MFEPQGPLPPEIYRRRRFAAVGLGLLAIIIVVSVIAVSCSGGSDGGSAAAQASSAKAVSTQKADADGAAGGASGSSAPKSSATGSPSATASASPSATGDSGAAAAGGEGAARGGGQEPQEAGGQCADSSISVTVAPGKPGYQVGDSVTFITTVANTAQVPCVRDLSGPKIVDTVATVGGDEVWSNADCYPGTGSDIRTLAPGEKAHFKMVWAGTSSKQGCAPAQRDPVEAGVYAVTAHVGDKASDPVPFNVR